MLLANFSRFPDSQRAVAPAALPPPGWLFEGGAEPGQEMPGSGCHLPKQLVDSQESCWLRLWLTCLQIAGTLAPHSSAMSKLGKFFKGSRSSRTRAAPSAQEALARLRETEEMLAKKQEYLENRIQRELALAKKHGSQNKRGRLCPRPSGPHSLPALPWGQSPSINLSPSRPAGLPF